MHDHVNSHFVKTTAASCSFYPPSGFSTVHPYPRSLRDIQRQLSDRFLLFRLLKPNGTYKCVFILLAIRRNRYISSLGEEKFLFLPPHSLPRNEALFEEASLNYLIKPVPRTVAIFRGRLAGCRDFSWIFMSRPCIGLCSDRIIERYVTRRLSQNAQRYTLN